jgi:hypothetical protein
VRLSKTSGDVASLEQKSEDNGPVQLETAVSGIVPEPKLRYFEKRLGYKAEDFPGK